MAFSFFRNVFIAKKEEVHQKKKNLLLRFTVSALVEGSKFYKTHLKDKLQGLFEHLIRDEWFTMLSAYFPQNARSVCQMT